MGADQTIGEEAGKGAAERGTRKREGGEFKPVENHHVSGIGVVMKLNDEYKTRKRVKRRQNRYALYGPTEIDRTCSKVLYVIRLINRGFEQKKIDVERIWMHQNSHYAQTATSGFYCPHRDGQSLLDNVRTRLYHAP